MTVANLKSFGTYPSTSDLFISFVITGTNSGKHFLTRLVGMGSDMLDFEFDFRIRSETSAVVAV